MHAMQKKKTSGIRYSECFPAAGAVGAGNKLTKIEKKGEKFTKVNSFPTKNGGGALKVN